TRGEQGADVQSLARRHPALLQRFAQQRTPRQQGPAPGPVAQSEEQLTQPAEHTVSPCIVESGVRSANPTRRGSVASPVEASSTEVMPSGEETPTRNVESGCPTTGGLTSSLERPVVFLG